MTTTSTKAFQALLGTVEDVNRVNADVSDYFPAREPEGTEEEL